MKRILILTAALLVLATTAQAGDWHSGTTLVCSDCHTMHASVTHTGATGNDTNWETGSWTPTVKLLKGGVNETCLTCHDGNANFPDVLTANNGMYSAADGRSAGALNANSNVTGKDTGAPSYINGHTLGITDVAPGDSGFDPGADGLSCIDCHRPHGDIPAGETVVDILGTTLTGTYRNLNWGNVRSGGTTSLLSISYESDTTVSARDTTVDVHQASSLTGVRYGTNNVNLNEPVGTDSGFGGWCGDCHTNFHSTVGTDPGVGGNITTGDFLRHPQAGVNIGAIGGDHSDLTTFQNKLYRVRVMSADTTTGWGSRNAAWTGGPSTVTPTCLTCHKAHGNGNPFGLIFAEGTTAGTELGEDGDGTYRDLCRQCHVQGG